MKFSGYIGGADFFGQIFEFKYLGVFVFFLSGGIYFVFVGGGHLKM